MEWGWHGDNLSRFIGELSDNGTEEFRDYLIRTRQQENLEFFEIARAYKETADRDKRTQRAACIIHEFLTCTAQKSINVSHSAVEIARVLARTGESDAFDTVEKEVEALLRNVILMHGVVEDRKAGPKETTWPRQVRSVSEPALRTDGDFKRLVRTKSDLFTRSSEALTLFSTLGFTVKCKIGEVTLCEDMTTSCFNFIARMKKLARVDGEFGVWITSEKMWMDDWGSLKKYAKTCADPNTCFVLKRREGQ